MKFIFLIWRNVCSAMQSGMASALETLCGQAYGAEQYKKVGSLTYGAILCLVLVCIPLSVLFTLTEKLLLMTGQDPLISAQAGKFAIQLIPTLFPYAILQCLVRYLQAQSLIFPMVWSSLAALGLQLPLCWAFVFKLGFGNTGAALSVGLSYWFNVVLLVLYVKYSPVCNKTFVSFSKDVMVSLKEFSGLAIPSAAMVCLEWWSFELILLLSGLLPNPQIETSVLSICFTISYLHYHVPYSFGAAASTLISNELGAGRPESARLTLLAVLILSIFEFLAASIAIITCGQILGYAFSKEEEIVDYVHKMAPFLGLSIIMDGLQATLSGVARGSGWQHIGAYVNLGAYYLVGTPVALLLAFVLHMKGQGLWSGLLAGATVQSIMLSVVTGLTDWEKQALEARQRIFTGDFPTEKESTRKKYGYLAENDVLEKICKDYRKTANVENRRGRRYGLLRKVKYLPATDICSAEFRPETSSSDIRAQPRRRQPLRALQSPATASLNSELKALKSGDHQTRPNFQQSSSVRALSTTTSASLNCDCELLTSSPDTLQAQPRARLPGHFLCIPEVLRLDSLDLCRLLELTWRLGDCDLNCN
ncbi:MATE efflux family protein [Striga hermonthica]|uniref:Protein DETOXIFICATION n=1 Tax=Striga hermonthica TaxID=68872 RepID=A0A9N7R8E1_STRHE|nr:MATE efflux family protein [Striga hermonthica]